MAVGKNVIIDGQTTDNVNTGSKTAGTTPLQIGASTRELKWGVQVVADSSNANPVWVGRRSNLTAGTSDENDGVKLPAGGTIHIPSNSEDKVWVVSDASNQEVTFLSY